MATYTFTIAAGVNDEIHISDVNPSIGFADGITNPGSETNGSVVAGSAVVDGVVIGVVGTTSLGSGNSFVVAARSGALQTLFQSVSFIDNTSTLRTLNSADATFTTDGVTGAVVWAWGTGTSAYLSFANDYELTFTTPPPPFTPPSITQDTPTVVSATDVILSWTASSGDDSGVYESFTVVRNGEVLFDDIDPSVTEWADPTGLPSTEYTYEIQGQYTTAEFSPVISNDQTITTGDMTDEFNCACASVTEYQTLAQLRQRVLVDLGYPNQASNPPPGMAAFVNSKLYGAQKLIYKQLVNHGLDTERFFRWTMTPGLRYYALNESEGECTLVLDPLKVTWVGFEDLNQAWYRLTAGIPPEFYTRANINFGWPTHYEIRQCLEIFPAPQAPYTLWVKGHFGLAPFAADSDTATIDDEAVFLLALGNCKAHYGQKDAQTVLTQAGNYIGGMVGGQHGTRRYVPRTKIQNPATPPRFLPLGGGQA